MNGIFTQEEVRGILEAENQRQLEMVFPFVAAGVDRVTGYNEESLLTKVCTEYSDIFNVIMSDNTTAGWSDLELKTMEQDKDNFKRLKKETFESLASDILFKLKYHLLDLLVTDLK